MKSASTFVGRMEQVIDYLEGKIDIYDGNYEKVPNTWNSAWDEMRYQNYQPDNPTHIRKYLDRNYN